MRARYLGCTESAAGLQPGAVTMHVRHACICTDVGATAAFCHCRELQPPPPFAAGWAEQRDALLHKVAAQLDGSGRDGRRAAGDRAAGVAAPVAAADAGAATAAEHAMQQLLVRCANVPEHCLNNP